MKSPGGPSNKGRKFPPDPPTPDELQSLIVAADTRSRTGRRARALIAVMGFAGLRCNEALALRLRDYSRETGELQVQEGKGRKRRVVALPVRAARYLDRWLDSDRADAGAGDFIFTTRNGRRMPGSAVRGVLPVLARRAGVGRRVAPHQLRHAFSRESIRRGMRINTLSRLLGHAGSGVTSKYVDSLTNQDALDEARKVWNEDDA